MFYEKIKNEQYNYILNDIGKEKYDWNNKHLLNELLGIVDEISFFYRDGYNKKLTIQQTNDNEHISKINSIIRKYNNKFEDNEKITIEIRKIYNNVSDDCKSYIYIDYILEQLNYGQKKLITGSGGIGKSCFMYDLYQKSMELPYKSIFIYGKYSSKITNSELIKLLTNIDEKSKNSKILIGIDAFNEFDKAKRKIIINYLQKKQNNNKRIIITNRDYSLKSIEGQLLISSFDVNIPFSGVDIIDSIRKMSEECNIDLTKYDEILYDNNPLHLKMLKSVISKNRLENVRNNSICIGTDIFEQYIRSVTKKYEKKNGEYWWYTKDIIDYMVSKDIANLKYSDLKTFLGSKVDDYIKVMQQEDFIVRNYDTIIFKSETLEAYLIARSMFSQFPKLKKEIVNYVNLKLKIFSFIQDQMLIMLFDKIKSMADIAFIIRNSDLKYYFGSIKFMNRIKLSKEKQKEFVKIFQCKAPLDELLFSSAGFENNALNCTNYLNKKIVALKNSNYNFNYSKSDIAYAKNNLVSWVRTIATFDCNKEYIEEKFWFAFWCMSLTNKEIRYLSRKLIFEIIYKNEKYINILQKMYEAIEDEFIKEGIIQILCSQSTNNIKVKRFINKINISSVINFRSLYYISNFLYKEEAYNKFNKDNILLQKKSRVKNPQLLEFFKRVIMFDNTNYNYLGMDRYKEKIKYSDKFMDCSKEKIMQINKYLNKYYNCQTYCNYTDCLKEKIIFPKFGTINDCKIKDYDIYFSWQELFKIELKKYSVKFKNLTEKVSYDNEINSVAYKALEIANNKLVGSLAANYYTSDFIIDKDYHKGYSIYYFEHFSESIDLFNPITIFSADIEYLNDKLINKILIPDDKNINMKWAKDEKLSLSNFKKLIEPIKYQNKKWFLIYGSIKIIKEYKKKLVWSDEYIINMAINEKYSLKKDPNEDRKYTIESRTYNGNLFDYNKTKYSQSTHLIKNTLWDNYFVESQFNLPPSLLVSKFNLIYDNTKSGWVNKNGEVVVLVSNNQDSWYKHGATGTIYLDEKYYNQLMNQENLKYFCFTERYFGYYNDESSLEIEHSNNNTNYYKHHKMHDLKSEDVCNNCKICIMAKENENKQIRHRKTKFEKFLEEYRFDETK